MRTAVDAFAVLEAQCLEFDRVVGINVDCVRVNGAVLDRLAHGPQVADADGVCFLIKGPARVTHTHASILAWFSEGTPTYTALDQRKQGLAAHMCLVAPTSTACWCLQTLVCRSFALYSVWCTARSTQTHACAPWTLVRRHPSTTQQQRTGQQWCVCVFYPAVAYAAAGSVNGESQRGQTHQVFIHYPGVSVFCKSIPALERYCTVT